MKILTFTSLFPNAIAPTAGIFVRHRMEHVHRRCGMSVEVLAPVPYSPPLVPERWRRTRLIPRVEQIGELSVHHPRYPLLPKVGMALHGLSMFLGSYPTVRHLHKCNQYDCIDAHYVYPDGFAAVLLGKALRIPVVISARGTDMTLFPQFPTIRPMIRYALRNAAGLIGVSSALSQEMVNNGAAPERTCTIGNGVDTDLFHPVPEAKARQQLGLPDRASIIVSVGALVAHKRHDLTIRSFAALRDRFPDSKLFILGEGPSRHSLQSLISDLGLHDHVFLRGGRPQQELRLWFSAAHITCLASSREGWPNVILESLACGTPVLATRVGGVPEVLASSEVGCLVGDTPEEFTAGLRSACERNWNRNEIVNYARSRPWQRVAAEVEEFLRVCVSTAGERARSGA